MEPVPWNRERERREKKEEREKKIAANEAHR